MNIVRLHRYLFGGDKASYRTGAEITESPVASWIVIAVDERCFARQVRGRIIRQTDVHPRTVGKGESLALVNLVVIALEGVKALIVGQSSCFQDSVVGAKAVRITGDLVGLVQQDVIGVVISRPGRSLIVDAIERRRNPAWLGWCPSGAATG
jgi:hypothetical protein